MSDMKANCVGVLRGGPSAEYDISMQTGVGVLHALQENGKIVKDIVISRTGQWLVNGFIKEPEQALIGVDVVFIALHGAYGEDGTVQRLLDRYSIPYTGSTPYASAIAINKVLTKELLSSFEVKTPKYMRVTRDGITDPFKTALSIGLLFGPQYVVKPTSGGSSLGICIAHNMQELGSVLHESLQTHDDLLIEELIKGKEATVGILENYRNVPVYNLPTIEIVPPQGSEFFSADVKYTGATEEICPGRFKKDKKQELARLAELIHTELGLRHYSRSDFMVTDDEIYFIEVNTLPGLTSESLYPKSVQAVGGTYNELVDHLVTLAYGNKVS